jgi:DNA-binding response OmpR family regulator
MYTATMISDDDSPSTASCPALKILLAEHDRKLRRLVCLALRFDCHDVEEASDGSEMLEAMASTIMDRDKRPFDLMVASNDLPDISGLTILAGLRARHWETPFVLMTDEISVGAQARRLRAAVVGRPSRIKAILAAVVEAYGLTDAVASGTP